MATSYLSRTLGTSTSRRTYTISTWVKRCLISNYAHIFTWGPNPGSWDSLRFDNDDRLAMRINADAYVLVSSALYRDTSAWYHIVCAIDTTQATSSDRIKLYINGQQLTSFNSSSYPTQNFDTAFTNGNTLRIGQATWNTNQGVEGNLASSYIIDGQALTPSSFGQTDTTTGIWKPKAYSGSYGTNGFFLKFENSGSLGTDSSGNGNNFTVNGTPTQTVDTPTNNFAILNTLDNQSASGSGSLANGNTYVAYSGGGFRTRSTIGTTKGKWYWEVKALTNTNQGFVGTRIGFLDMNDSYNNNSLQTMEGVSFGAYVHPTAGVYRVVNSANTLVDANLTYTNNDIISLALDCDNNISYWYKNGSLVTTFDFSSYASVGQWILTPTTGNSSGSASPTMAVNYGNGYFETTAVSGNYADGAGYGKFQYQPRTGHYALCTRNLNTYG